jgi:hypothetical protein
MTSGPARPALRGRTANQVVEKRTDADGNIATEAAIKAEAD